MSEPTAKPEKLPSDDEIAEMLATATPKKRGKKTDDTQPTPRLPEAAYYFLFLMLETAIFMGVWGDMSRDTGGTLEIELLGLVGSLWDGLLLQVTERWWMAAVIAFVSAAVFLPRTPLGRRRIARLVGGIIAAAFAVLIALQFKQDMASLSELL